MYLFILLASASSSDDEAPHDTPPGLEQYLSTTAFQPDPEFPASASGNIMRPTESRDGSDEEQEEKAIDSDSKIHKPSTIANLERAPTPPLCQQEPLEKARHTFGIYWGINLLKGLWQYAWHTNHPVVIITAVAFMVHMISQYLFG